MTASANSIHVYHNEIKGTKENTQNELVLSKIKELCKPATARMLQPVTGLEINSLSRTLNNLCHKQKVIEIMFSANCPVTGRKAAHYVESGYPDQSKTVNF